MPLEILHGYGLPQPLPEQTECGSVTAPLYRYHPAVIAQAFASLDMLYPDRIGLGIETGETMRYRSVSIGQNRLFG
jgi:hypothetical protein